MLCLGLASKLGLHLVTIAHFVEISALVYNQNIYRYVHLVVEWGCFACNILLKYAIHMSRESLKALWLVLL
jgi:hypothetical protein